MNPGLILGQFSRSEKRGGKCCSVCISENVSSGRLSAFAVLILQQSNWWMKIDGFQSANPPCFVLSLANDICPLVYLRHRLPFRFYPVYTPVQKNSRVGEQLLEFFIFHSWALLNKKSRWKLGISLKAIPCFWGLCGSASPPITPILFLLWPQPKDTNILLQAHIPMKTSKVYLFLRFLKLHCLRWSFYGWYNVGKVLKDV